MDSALCICGCGEPAVLAARHCPRTLRLRIEPSDYRIEDRGHVTPCFIFNGKKGNDRYAMVRMKGREIYAHRAMYEQEVGPIPDGYFIDHLCCVTRCIRPSHLEAVTPAENTRRGRNAKLTTTIAAEIRSSKEAARALGKRLGVTEFTIYQIRAGKTWR